MKTLPTAVKRANVSLSIKEPISILCHRSKKKKKGGKKKASSILNSPKMKKKENANVSWYLTAEESCAVCAD